MRQKLASAVGLAVAIAVWIPSVHLFFDGRSEPEGRAAIAQSLLARQTRLWSSAHAGWVDAREASLDRMRAANGEWDFMSRTFLVLSLANLALEDSSTRAEHLATIDAILEDTLRLEAERGQSYFLLPYAHARPFVDPSARSVFVDGEIALMLAARQNVRLDARWSGELASRIALIEAQMRRGPITSAESYPDECWTFCNTVALAAVRLHDRASGEDHGELLRRWVANAQEHLVDPDTGMLVSSYTRDGRHLDGPEGSSLFMAAHMLSIVDPDFAADQFARARRELGVTFAGFGWAKEWPTTWRSPSDVDSGPVVPVVDASAGASGMAILGAATFGDETFLEALHTSLELAAFPVADGDGVRYAASNQVGDAVLLYSLVQGPLFEGVPPARSARHAAVVR